MMKLNEKNIFLIDGIGAVLSAGTTGLLLPIFVNGVGLSVSYLRLLGLVGLLFAIFSFGCFLFSKKPRPFMLVAIILANSVYGMLALSIAVFSSTLTSFGRAYFVGEAAILLGLVLLESRVYRRSFG